MSQPLIARDIAYPAQNLTHEKRDTADEVANKGTCTVTIISNRDLLSIGVQSGNKWSSFSMSTLLALGVRTDKCLLTGMAQDWKGQRVF